MQTAVESGARYAEETTYNSGRTLPVCIQFEPSETAETQEEQVNQVVSIPLYIPLRKRPQRMSADDKLAIANGMKLKRIYGAHENNNRKLKTQDTLFTPFLWGYFQSGLARRTRCILTSQR
jgi:hypothetical protein